MKILVCHGYGMSSEILEQMMSSVISAIGRHHEWVFLDGEVTVNRSAMAEFIPGRHLSYWDAWGAEGLKAAFELMEDTIEEKGPFDGVYGYSQGGAFVLGYLLQRLIDHPEKPLPFKFVAFQGTAAALSSDPEYNSAEIMSALEKLSEKEKKELHDGFISRQGHKDPRTFDAVKDGRIQGRDKEIFVALIDMVQSSLGARNFFGIDESDGTNAIDPDSYGLADFPRFFNPVYTKQRIPIPTVHIRGHFDDPAATRLAEIAQELCDPSKVQLVKYNGVHELPTKEPDVTNIARAIEKAYGMGQLLSVAV
ncbi:Esterase alnB [Pseudocercospora fuligena]|uniref:Esterase alnB n=1 Tax=Pseudocercospora fuligena TaxID=685502 RepID=A0A8H6R801_9PEZI|nr:Esterase alnB [Pseudocercospora fuligena]